MLFSGMLDKSSHLTLLAYSEQNQAVLTQCLIANVQVQFMEFGSRNQAWGGAGVAKGFLLEDDGANLAVTYSCHTQKPVVEGMALHFVMIEGLFTHLGA